MTACFERANERVLEIARQAAESPADRFEALREAIRQVFRNLADTKTPILTSHVGVGRLTPEAHAKIRDRIASLGQAYRVMLESGISEGTIRTVPVDDVVVALAGLLN